MHMARTLTATTLVASLIAPWPAYGYEFGVGGYVAGEDNRSSLIDAMGDVGASIDRESFTYSTNPNFEGPDIAVDGLRAKNIEIVAVVGFDGTTPPSTTDWAAFLTKMVGRYKGRIAAWEIFNEQDWMSGSTYKPYLETSYNTIKAIDPSAKVIVGGLTARSEAVSFWNALYDAGGKDYFDALGLHPYFSTAPETVNYNTGDFVGAIELAANAIRAHGGGKKIWITEFGYQADKVGSDNQANWLARSFILARTVPEVEKVIMYRLRSGGDGDSSWGLLKSDRSQRTAYDRYKSVVAPLTDAGSPTKVYAVNRSRVDGLESSSGWSTGGGTSTDVSVGTTSAYHYDGLKLDYKFTASNAFLQAEKEIAISGEPSAIGVWAKGPETTSTFKVRIVDANGETFQIDLGKTTSDFRFYSFVFGVDKAITSWGGDGTVNYPIKFNSFIYDRNSGQESGTVVVDELQVAYGAGDLHAYKFGNKLAYWRASGSGTKVTVCGAEREFTETPKIDSNIDGGSCTTDPKNLSGAATSSSSSSSESSEAPTDPGEAIGRIGAAGSIDEANQFFADAVTAINRAYDDETASARTSRDEAITNAEGDAQAAIDAANTAYDEATAGAATARDEAIDGANVTRDEAIANAGDDVKAIKAAERTHAKVVKSANANFIRATRGALAAKKKALAAASVKKRIAAANATFKRATAGATRTKNARLNAAKKAKTAKIRALTPKKAAAKKKR